MIQLKKQKPNSRTKLTKKFTYFIALFLITLASFGNNYSFNNPQALHQPLKQTLNINQSQFQLLYSIFAFPNILSALFIGYLIDFFQIYKGFIILIFSIAFFQTIVAIGAYNQSYTLILIGRLFFGICSESLITAQAALVSSLFKRKNLALALGVVITFPQIGNALNSLFTFRIYELFDNNLGAPFFASVFICLFCSIFAILAIKFIKIINKEQQQLQRIKINDQSTIVSDILSQSGSSVDAQSHKQTIRIQDLKQLTFSFWLLTIICTILLGLYIPFLDGANGLIMTRFRYDEQTTGQIIMVTYFATALFSIPCGILIDKIGQRRYISILCAFLLLTVQLILYFSDQNTHIIFIILAFLILGLGFSIYANCVLSCVSLIVKKKILGTAFGLVQMLQSVSLSVFPIISGALVDQGSQSEEGFLDSEIFFIIVGISGAILSFGLLFLSKNTKQKLDQAKNKKPKSIKSSFTMQTQFSRVSSWNLQKDKSISLNKSLLSTNSSISSQKQKEIQNLLNIYLPPSDSIVK